MLKLKQSDKKSCTKDLGVTIISTTNMAMLQSELPRDRKFVKDSCPGVSITNKPGILYSCCPSCNISFRAVDISADV